MLKLIKTLYPYLRSHLRLVIGSLLFSIPLAGVKVYQAYLVKPIFDQGLSSASSQRDVFFLCAILLGLALLNYPFRFFHFFWIRKVVEHATCDLRLKLYAKFQKLPLTYFTQNKVGELMSHALSDTQILSQGFRASVDLVREPLTALFLLSLAFYRDWQLSLVVCVVFPLFVIIFQKSGNKIRKHTSEVQASMGEMTHHLQEGLAGQKIGKAFNLQNYFLQRLKKAQDFNFLSIMKTSKIEENAHPLVELVGAMAFVGVILFAHHRVASGELTTGGFISFVTALALFMDPIRKFSQANVKMNQALAASKRIFQVLDLEEEKDSGSQKIESFKQGITVSHLTFSYGEKEVLKDFSLAIKKGEKVALVGLSGSGKTTLINLLLRLYPHKKGAILFDGIPLEEMTLDSLRSQFGLVSQDIFLFHDTVRENLCLGKSYPIDKITEALKVAEALDFVQALPQGLETMIGDRGIKLSGGQAQRLTIARAYLANAPILLFDEATSALDNESEKMVQKALEQLGQDKTILAVAHRLSTIQNYDKIVVLKEGMIVESGTHSALMQKQGEYFRLYQLSLG
ncbi:MAG: ABC transporter ATP-binding protein [Bacteriovoracaceae bacterium]|nr:ABC transporter ATP-binding protein [Bacteriovoracaceae bacterium]